jgi:Flp pilus assembly protein TadD
MSHALAIAAVALFTLLNIIASPALAVGTEDGSSDTATLGSYEQAEAAIRAGDFAAALPILSAITAAEPENADAWNLLGFSSRKTGDLEAAALAYARALTINPGHLGALEYQGEMFLEMGRPEEAKANLATLQSLCGSCEEAVDLQEAIAAAGV